LSAQDYPRSDNERVARQKTKFPSVMLNQFTEKNLRHPEQWPK
jgi:hypothetical protein